ncbi:MAG: yecD, partial [candidate division NC10 bacterium]|nr:yecD [candidate division NC10 bacterium]
RVYTDTDHQLKPWKDAERQNANLRPLAVAGTQNAQIIDELAPDEDDYVLRKHRWSGLFQTPLELSLRTRGVDTMILCGGLVSSGLASTAYSALDRDFNLVFAKDCCTWHSQGELDFFMTEVFPRMGRVRTADEVIAMLRSA